jgi:uncharacterized membrane-anchored protein
VEAAPYKDEATIVAPVPEAGYGMEDSLASEPEQPAKSPEEAFAASESDQEIESDKPEDNADTKLAEEAGKPLVLDRLPDDPGVADDEKKEPARFRLF